jgi:uncharacterized membrane protein
VSLEGLSGESPVFYSLSHEGAEIDFFVLEVDGEVQSYFDACIKCYPKKMGYRAEGDEVVCRACGVRYSVHDLRGGLGSCRPIPLEGRREGEHYIMEKKDIIKGARYF